MILRDGQHQEIYLGRFTLVRHDYDGDVVQILDERNEKREPGRWARQAPENSGGANPLAALPT